MDTEEEIEKMAEKLTNDQGWTKLKALSMLQNRYESERRLEEAVIVKRIIDRGIQTRTDRVRDSIMNLNLSTHLDHICFIFICSSVFKMF